LLKDAGCSANAERMAALFGADDREAKRTSKLTNWSSPVGAFAWSLRTIPPREWIARLRAIRAEGDVTRGFMAARCERGAEIARMLYLTDSTAEAIRALDEHWDGRGAPAGLQGEEIPLLARILCLAQTAEVFHAEGGVRAVRRVVRRRRGRWFDPSLVDALLGVCGDHAFWRALAVPDVSAWEPSGDRRLLGDDARLDRITEAFARVIDAKSPYTARHSERVAEIAVGLGAQLGLGRTGLRDLRRAALLHDIGKLAISNRILDKPGRLGEDEFALIKAHPLYSLRILERADCFAPLAPLAAAHHEKLDGSGYPFGLAGDTLDLPMRVLAVADVYEALTALRPYRGPMAPQDALAVIRRDVPHKLDARVVAALEDLIGTGGAAPLARAA
jgi:HD-GYP domain-containing protein (c-di-GMP phosphodiesterase class II)